MGGGPLTRRKRAYGSTSRRFAFTQQLNLIGQGGASIRGFVDRRCGHMRTSADYGPMLVGVQGL
jgi:hypothetical protein